MKYKKNRTAKEKVWDFADRGVIPNSNYDWGTAWYFCHIGVVVVFVGAIYLLIAKIKNK